MTCFSALYRCISFSLTFRIFCALLVASSKLTNYSSSSACRDVLSSACAKRGVTVLLERWFELGGIRVTKVDCRILLGPRASSITHCLPVLSSETRRILVQPSGRKCVKIRRTRQFGFIRNLQFFRSSALHVSAPSPPDERCFSADISSHVLQNGANYSKVTD